MNEVEKPFGILLIDKENKWLDFSREILANNGYLARIAFDFESAKEILDNKDISLVLVDANLLESNNVFQEIIANQSKRNYHVVTLSSMSYTPVSMRKAFKLGVYDCEEKCYYENELVEIVERQLAELKS